MNVKCLVLRHNWKRAEATNVVRIIHDRRVTPHAGRRARGSMNLKCLVLRHRWRPAEATNEPGLRLACMRCGKVRGVGGTGARADWNAPETRMRHGG